MNSAERGATRGGVVLVVVLLGAVALGVLIVRARLNTGERLANPETVSLPAAPNNRTAVIAYFHHDGAPLLKLLQATGQLPPKPEAAFCANLSEKELEPVGGPSQLADLALAVPDLTTRDAAVNHVDGVVRYVRSCSSRSGISAAAERVNFTAIVLTRALVQDGAL